MITDTRLTPTEIYILEELIDHRGIQDVLVALSEICGAKSDHIQANWQDRALSKRWATIEGALGVIVPKAEGL